MFICFISKDYCNSIYCLKELSLAHDCKKKILPVILERDGVFNGVDLLVENVLKYEAFKRENKLEPWSHNNFEKLNEKIFNILSKVCIKCSGMHPIIDYDAKMV